MGKKQKAISTLVVVLGLISASIAIVAEIRQSMGNNGVSKKVEGDVKVCYNWEKQNQRVPQIGALAITILVLAQIIINVAGGWICCVPIGKNNDWVHAMLSLILCWVFFVIAIVLYIAGILLNSKKIFYCYDVTPGLFSGGAFSALLTVASGVLYYIKVSALTTSEDKTVSFDL
ncbi:hypothetical protein SUGI_0180390 [Cryptomeria japonica]|nr:hypothetical protein SUGI_0180390 [Cryptomeria japonica]